MKSCVWQERFSSELAKIEPNPVLADDLIRGVEWVLARDPKKGLNIEGTSVWYIVCRDNPKRRYLVIFYTFSGEKVFFMSVMESTGVL